LRYKCIIQVSASPNAENKFIIIQPLGPYGLELDS
jgi:hypothetical protein